jgi:putative thymidine phosphorylase
MIKDLIPKRIPIRVGHKFIAILNETTAEKLDLHPADRVIVKVGRRDVTAILDITERKELKDNQIGLYAETWEELKVKRGDRLRISIAPKPIVDEYIKDKLEGKTLTAKQIDAIIKEVVADDLSDIEMTYFVSGCFANGLNDDETVALTKAIVKYGDRLTFKKKIVMDKHCIGGVPGNRTTMVIIPIITALGYTMPKTSSRAITSPSGTADTMEVLANVVNDADKLKKIANKVGGFITWGGGVDLAAADDKLIRVRYPLKLDPQGMLLASIMAKKFSVSTNHLIIDIPIGPQAKLKTMPEAMQLRKRFISIGKKLGMKMKVVITDGSQPIGNGVGPLLECLDVIKVLKNEDGASKNLRDKSIMLATKLLSLTTKYKTEAAAKKAAAEVLYSGKAWDKFEEIIEAQGKKRIPKLGEYQFHFKSTKKGKVKAIDNKLIARIARSAGAPLASGAGVYIHKHIGDKIEKGEKLFTVYAENKDRLKYVKKLPLETAYKIN